MFQTLHPAGNVILNPVLYLSIEFQLPGKLREF